MSKKPTPTIASEVPAGRPNAMPMPAYSPARTSLSATPMPAAAGPVVKAPPAMGATKPTPMADYPSGRGGMQARSSGPMPDSRQPRRAVFSPIGNRPTTVKATGNA